MSTRLLTKPIKFIIGKHGAEFYIHQGFVSRLSVPLNDLVNSTTVEASEDSVIWEDVEEDIFWRFAQFVYTGSYADFRSFDLTYHLREGTPNKACEVGTTIDMNYLETPLKPANVEGYIGDSSSSVFLATNIVDPFRLPYSLMSYNTAARSWDWFYHPEAMKCKPQDHQTKQKPGIGPCNGSPSKKKRDAIAVFMSKYGGFGVSLSNKWSIFEPSKPVSFGQHMERTFVGHVEIFLLAERYSVTQLMDRALSQLGQELAQWTILPSTFVPDFARLIRYIYNSPVTGCLRQIVAEFAACMVEDVSGLEGWQAMLQEVPEFTADLLRQLMNRLE
jgi:hypothetical protein